MFSGICSLETSSLRTCCSPPCLLLRCSRHPLISLCTSTQTALNRQMRASLFILGLFVAGALHEAAAARQLSQAPAGTATVDTITWLPFKDAAGVWQPANTTEVDYATLTLSDLPAPDVFIDLAVKSPFPMPKIPMQKLVENTMKEWSGGKLPASANDWLTLLQGAGGYAAQHLPALLVKILPNITLEGQTISLGAEAGKVLGALSNATTIDIALPLPAGSGIGGGRPMISLNISQGVEFIESSIKDFPGTMEKLGEKMAERIEKIPALPPVEAILGTDGTVDIPAIIKETFNISVPKPPTLLGATQSPAIQKVVSDVTKALPAVASQLGIDTSAIKFPDAKAVQALLSAANGDSIFLTDRYGRVDILGSLVQLPTKLPQLAKLAEAVTGAVPAPPQGWPDMQQAAKLVAKMVGPTS